MIYQLLYREFKITTIKILNIQEEKKVKNVRISTDKKHAKDQIEMLKLNNTITELKKSLRKKERRFK